MVLRRGGRPGLIGTAARTAVIAGTAQATVGAVAAKQQKKAAAAQAAAQSAAPPPAAPVAEPAAGAPDEDLVGKIQQLAKLHAAGVLTDDEFAAAKAKLLG